MTDYTNDIKRYLNGEMTPAEMHALEKKALADPFLSDALEGASSVGAHDFASEISAINDRIEGHAIAASNEASTFRTAVQPASSAAVRPVVQPVAVTSRAMRIAAGLILLVAATFAIWQFSKQSEDEPLALNETVKDNAETPSEEDSPAGVETTPTGKIEASPATEGAGPVSQSKSGSSVSTYPAEAKAKAQQAVADAQPEVEEKKDDHAGELETQPALSVAKTREQVGNAGQTEKPVELAAAHEREEGKLEKKDARADDSRKKVPGVARSGVQQDQTIIQGKVTATEDGSPLPGVNVVIKGTSIGTITNAEGNYQVESAQANPSLVFSFIGLQSQEVSAGDRKQVDVQMALDAAQLSEVVVTGYGFQNAAPYTPTFELAHPSTGNRAFKQYMESNVRYPMEALEKKIEGRVTVEFFVETDGTLTNFTTIRGIGAGCEEELIRLIREGPEWEPSRKDGVPIRDKARVRLKFELPKRP